MHGLLRELMKLPALQETAEQLRCGETPVSLTGVSPVHRAQLCAALAAELTCPLAAVCADEKDASRLSGDLYALTGTEPVVLPAREWQLRPAAAASREWEHRRLQALHRIAAGDAAIVVMTAAAAAQYCMPRRLLLAQSFSLQVGESYDVPGLAVRLAEAGYVRCEQVEGPGQFALRGGILDIYSPGLEDPVRCEFFDDELDAMGAFSVVTQRRTENRHQVLILPAAESAGDDSETIWDYLAPDSLVTVQESARVGEVLRDTLRQLREELRTAAENGERVPPLQALALDEEILLHRMTAFRTLLLDSFAASRLLLPPKALIQLSVKQLSTYGGSLETACTDMVHYLTMGYGVLVLCGGEVRAGNMQRLLDERGIHAALDFAAAEMPGRNEVRIAVGAMSAGSEYPSLHLAILTEGQLTDKVSGKARRARHTVRSNQQKIQAYTDLVPGDLVVHVHHGIGRFVGILRMPVDGVEKDYMKIAYAGSDCLYVPCTSLDLVSKYIGAGGTDSEKPARLNKLGGTEWGKTTYRAKAAARELAEELIKLYAQRQQLGGYAFSPDSPWQQEFEEAFDYTETDDQLRAISEIKQDMEKPVPMDRLLCGDVGYGKTEVALRAAMKCIMDGKQAAILVPTTVLAQQHYVTAMSRFRSFPVNIEVLSRFRSSKQEKDVLQRLREGRVDLLIGTHKLLQKNVEFRDLGLLIIDEEQRFGVKHKELLREKSRQVDTLTLSATPIPRTLNMALSGIRDMSTIEEPPQDRQPVQTYVMEHDWLPVIEAIRRELDRGGQVYYLHNRVESIASTAYRLQQMLGEDVALAVAHGKMNETELSRVM